MQDRTRLSRTVWWGLAVVALCLVGMVAVTVHENHVRTLREAGRNAQNSAALLAEELRSLVSSTEMLLSLIERRGLSDPRSLGSRMVDDSGTLDAAQDFVAGGIFTRRGLLKPVVTDSSTPEIPAGITEDLMDGIGPDGRVWITRPFESGGRYYVLLGRRPRSLATSQHIAVAVMMPLGRLMKLVGEPDVGSEGVVALLRKDGLMLARAPGHPGMLGRTLPQLSLFGEIAERGATGNYQTHFGTDGVLRLVNYRVLDRLPVVVAVAPSYREALASWRKDLVRDGALLAVVLLLLYTAGALISRVSRRREEAEAHLKEKSGLLEATLAHMDQGLLLVDADDRVPVYNRRALELLDLPEELLARRPHGSEINAFQLARGEYDRLDPRLRELMKRPPTQLGRVTFERERPDGTVLEMRSVPLPDGGAVRTYTDVTERRRAEGEIRRLAHRDVLTGLANRASFLEHLMRACGELDGDGEPFALLCLDLDRFKHVNDTLGHPTGDALLREVARRLSALTGARALAARLGGDEFALILYDCEDQAAVDRTVRRIVASLNAPYSLEMGVPDVSVSGGTALAPFDGTDPDALLRRADLALYEAKSAGRCVVRAFTPAMEERAQHRRLLLADLGEALGGDQFRLEYQPIFGIDNRLVHGLEALIRWDHPTRGAVSPADFIPLAEESDLIDRLGEWILVEACREAVEWPGSKSVAVNISAMQFVRDGLVEAVHSALRMSGLPPHRLHLEITESALMSETAETIGTLQELRALGPRIVLDDFGTGHSSLSHLCSFPFDRIKIDRSFIRGATRHRNSRAVIDAIAALGQELGIPTTAEGVETEAQFAIVKGAGCSEVQGFLYARPMQPEAVRSFLAQRSEYAA